MDIARYAVVERGECERNIEKAEYLTTGVTESNYIQVNNGTSLLSFHAPRFLSSWDQDSVRWKSDG